MPTININPVSWLNVPLAMMPNYIAASGITPILRVINGDLYSVWVALDTTSNYIQSVYILRVKSNKEYCAYLYGNGGVVTNTVGCFNNGNFFSFFAHKNIVVLSVPTVFTNGTLYAIQAQKNQNLLSNCAISIGANSNYQLGPFYNSTAHEFYYIYYYINPSDAQTAINGYKYDDMANGFQTYIGNNATPSQTFGDSTFDASIVLGLSSSQARIDGNGQQWGFNNSTGRYNTLIKINFSGSIGGQVCYDPSNYNIWSRFILSTNKQVVLTVPILQDFVFNETDNNFFGLVSSAGGYLYLFSNPLNFSQLYNNIGYGAGSSAVYWNGNFYFSMLIGGAGISTMIASPVVPPQIPPMYLSNSNYPGTSAAGSSAVDFQTQLLNTKHYLINFNRPISVIGAYKT